VAPSWVRHGPAAGAQAVELMAILPLVVLLVACGAQVLVLARQQAEAEADARVLARQAAICHDVDPDPAAVDRALRPGDVTVTRLVASVVVSVRLSPQTIVPGLPGGSDSRLAPGATVAMRREPC
jgi:hypothetical protein